MRKLFTAVLLLLSMSMFALRPQQRKVVIDTVCNASLEHFLHLTDSFCYEFQACPDSLFSWAYMGLGEAEIVEASTKESRDVIQLRYKDRTYDATNKVGDVAIDIYVLGVRWWKDQHLVTKCHHTHPQDKEYPITVHLEATYSGSILQGGDIYFSLIPITDTKTSIHYEFSLVFGKILSAFISDKTWNNAIRWRLATILDNMIEFAETGEVQPKEEFKVPKE